LGGACGELNRPGHAAGVPLRSDEACGYARMAKPSHG
jgi:hypothetical protein